MSDYIPTRVRKWEQPKVTADSVKLGSMELGYRTKTKHGSKATELEGISVYRGAGGRHDDILYMIDVVCSPMEWRAVHACLTTGVTAKFKFRGCGNDLGSWRTFERDKTYGYRTYHERFTVDGSRSNSKIHYIAVSNNPGFLPQVDPISMAYKLASPMFSTPFLSPVMHGQEYDDWVPYIMDEAIKHEMLTYMECFNCVSGFVHARENIFQEIVSRGVRTGILKWPEYDPAEIIEACRERDASLSVVEACEEDGVLAEALPAE